MKGFQMICRTKMLSWLLGLCIASTPLLAAAADNVLPVPDGNPADMSKPVKVFILLGQSNMLGMGHITGDKEGTLEHAVKAEKKYPFLVNADGTWTERKDV